MPASVSILMRQLPAMRLICIALMSVILTFFCSAATSGLNRVKTPAAGRAMARRIISRRVKVDIPVGYDQCPRSPPRQPPPPPLPPSPLPAGGDVAPGSILAHGFLDQRVVFPIEIIPGDPFIVHSLPHAILLAICAAACFIAGFGRFPQLFPLLYFYACAAALAIGASLLLARPAVLPRAAHQILPPSLNLCFSVTPIASAGS